MGVGYSLNGLNGRRKAVHGANETRGGTAGQGKVELFEVRGIVGLSPGIVGPRSGAFGPGDWRRYPGWLLRQADRGWHPGDELRDRIAPLISSGAGSQVVVSFASARRPGCSAGAAVTLAVLPVDLAMPGRRGSLGPTGGALGQPLFSIAVFFLFFQFFRNSLPWRLAFVPFGSCRSDR